ncbi:MAG: DNA alkylation repair protein [Leptospiraceae bacterium]|nr:DNA alkylation repair protein [Leptospiraceae bacterium]
MARAGAIVTQIQAELQAAADPQIAAHSAGFFQAVPGGYGARDQFLGIRVPLVRRVIGPHKKTAQVTDATHLLHSAWHEERMAGVLLLVALFERRQPDCKGAVFEAYIKYHQQINNWDLIDVSAPKIVGPWLFRRDRDLLYQWIDSASVWQRRIAILAAFYFVHQHEYQDMLALCENRLADRHDLIHKATGWMLREIGKRDQAQLEYFLKQHAARMPRTMLRYAIEKLPSKERQVWLQTPRQP